MFDSKYNVNSILPIYQSSSHHPFDDHLFNNFPCYLLDDELFLNTILPYNPPPSLPTLPPPQPLSTRTDEATDNSSEKKVEQKGMKKKQEHGGGSSKRRTGKKDRHSKIYTAHGPRDRRMRLSLQTARKFFDLQDMLGFDKASKTIEWLFNKSKAAIKDLSDKSCTSIVIPSSPLGEIKGNNNNEKLSEKMSNNKGGMFINNEKRKEARARARERTKEKLMMQKQGKEMNKNYLEMEENPNSINVMESNNNVMRVNKVLNHEQPLEDHLASVGIIEKFLAASSSTNDFGHDSQDGALTRAFSMDFGKFGAISPTMGGPNFAFMDRTYNHGY